jgi:uncharacterized protein
MLLYVLCLAVPMLLSLWASSRVNSQFRKYSQLPASSGMTGAQVAQRIMSGAGIHDVTIHSTPQALSDHYDPTNRRLVLCDANYHGTSVAAIGVAAHEAGHALQHAKAYAPLHWRMSAVHITTAAGTVMGVIGMGGYFLLGSKLAIMIMAAAAAVTMLFQLVTLPVEFDATARAKRAVADMRMVMPGAETEGMNKVLDAAALTYVAAFVGSLMTLLYYGMQLLGGSRDED